MLGHLRVAACLLALTVAGCGGDQRDPIRDVKYGMTKERVMAIMGEPDRKERSAPAIECWFWGGSAERGPHSNVCFEEEEAALIVPAPDSTDGQWPRVRRAMSPQAGAGASRAAAGLRLTLGDFSRLSSPRARDSGCQRRGRDSNPRGT